MVRKDLQTHTLQTLCFKVYLVIWDRDNRCHVPAVPICWEPDGNMSPTVFVSEPR